MKHFVTLVVFVVLSVLGHSPVAQTNFAAEITELAERHDHAALVEKLTALRSSDRKRFEQRDYDYLLGHAAEAEGMIALAMSSYGSVANRDSVLRTHALAHLSRIARSSGNLLLERTFLNELSIFSQAEQPFKAAAKSRLALNAFESENYGETIRVVSAVSGESERSSNERIRETRALVGEAYRLLGKVEKAKLIFDEILDTVPNADQPDDATLAAVTGLDAINGSDPSLNEAEHWRRANIYQFNRYFDQAKLHFEAVFAANPAGANAAASLFQIGRGFAQRENFVEALAWYERVLERYPSDAAAKDALLQVAAAYSRVGKPKEAIKRYHDFIDKYPLDEKLDRAYLNLVDILRDQGADTDALKWCSKTADVFKGKVPEALAVFAEARIYLSREDWQNALAALDRLNTLVSLGGANAPGGTTKGEVTFLRGFVFERLGKFDDAIAIYLSIADGRGEYYGWRASQRLKQLATDDKAKPLIENRLTALTDGLKSKDSETRRTSAQDVLRLVIDRETRERALNVLRSTLRNLPSYKVPSLAPVPSTPRSDAVMRLQELRLPTEAEPDKAASDLSAIEPRWKKMPVDFPIELIPRDQLILLYPAPFVDELLRHATTRGVDPRFVLAIMRQESRFSSDARSVSAARGLMQFIHSTTARVSNELGRGFFRDEDMYDPETSILFGAHHISGLLAMFPERYEAVAAAYNGGETNVKRWLARVDSSDPDRYLPEIVFGQSKDYAAKVLANYRMYRYLYDERLALKPSPRSE